MTDWTSVREGEPPLYLKRDATTTTEVSNAMFEVVAYMNSRFEQDGCRAPTQLLVYVNATNGYVQFAWFDEDDKPDGDWSYTLTLMEGLYALEDAFKFDETCYESATRLARDPDSSIPQGVTVMFRTELGGAKAIT